MDSDSIFPWSHQTMCRLFSWYVINLTIELIS